MLLVIHDSNAWQMRGKTDRGSGATERQPQETLWALTEDLATAPRHVSFGGLSRLLTAAGCDGWLERAIAGINPGVADPRFDGRAFKEC